MTPGLNTPPQHTESQATLRKAWIWRGSPPRKQVDSDLPAIAVGRWHINLCATMDQITTL